jgi:hypothetical protein
LSFAPLTPRFFSENILVFFIETCLNMAAQKGRGVRLAIFPSQGMFPGDSLLRGAIGHIELSPPYGVLLLGFSPIEKIWR